MHHFTKGRSAACRSHYRRHCLNAGPDNTWETSLSRDQSALSNLASRGPPVSASWSRSFYMFTAFCDVKAKKHPTWGSICVARHPICVDHLLVPTSLSHTSSFVLLLHSPPSLLVIGFSIMEDTKLTKGLAQGRDGGRAESQEDLSLLEKKGTPNDQKDMQRMGKPQELRRNFRFVSIYGYSMGEVPRLPPYSFCS